MKIVATSDWHWNRSDERNAQVLSLLADIRAAYSGALVVCTGDATDNGDWAGAPIDGVLFVLGNHEGGHLGAFGTDAEKIATAQQRCLHGSRRVGWHYGTGAEIVGVDSCQHGSGFTSRGTSCFGDGLRIGCGLPPQNGYPVIVLVHHDPLDVSDPFLTWPGGPDFVAMLPAESIILCGHVGGEVTVRAAERNIIIGNADGCVEKRACLLVDTDARSIERVALGGQNG